MTFNPKNYNFLDSFIGNYLGETFSRFDNSDACDEL
jgi:hypothetical protein